MKHYGLEQAQGFQVRNEFCRMYFIQSGDATQDKVPQSA
jgi:hypothetical protein